MRPKLVFGAIAGGALLLAVVYFASSPTTTTTSPPDDVAITNSQITRPTNKARNRADTRVAQTNPAGDTQAEMTEMDNALAVVTEKTLPTLSAKLSSTDRAVRSAAVSNLVTLADRDAIPALTEAIDRASDSEEKTNIVKAIEFLQLPTYNELVANGTAPPLTRRIDTTNSAAERYSPETIRRSQPLESQ